MTVTGTGIASGTTVTAVSGSTITLSNQTSSAESSAVTLSFNGTTPAFYTEVKTGAWQCVPCDGDQGYQCCSVVCGPTSGGAPSLGYTWGANATLPPPPTSVVNAYQGCGTDSAGGDTDCPHPGYPDYVGTGFVGKFCTIDGGKPFS
jgi:hypothetical protein